MKIKQCQEILKQQKLDALLCYSLGMEYNPNVYYFTQYSGVGALIIPKKGKAMLIVPKMEYERAKRSFSNVLMMDKKRFFETIAEVLKRKKLRFRDVGIDSAQFSLLVYKRFKKSFRKTRIKDVSFDLLKLREVKNSKEIAILKKGFSYANGVFEKTMRNFKDFKLESDVAAFMEYESKKQGLDLSFPVIVASGKNGSMPHYFPTMTKLNKGLCVIDFGVKYKGYCTDMTRTISIGRPSRGEKEMYEFVLKVQNGLVKAAKVGVSCGYLYEKCASDLGKYSKYFTHGLGHGVGVEIHELPNLTLGSKDKLQVNVPFTIEPGVYLPGKFGIRIEDTLIAGKKQIMLTKVSKKLRVV